MPSAIDDLPPPNIAQRSKGGIDDLPPPPEVKPGFFQGAVKSAVDSLPMVGGVAGGILGTPADVIAGPMGNIAGAGIGGYLGTAAKNAINHYIDPDNAPKTMGEVLTQPVVGGVEQGLMQGSGEAAAPYIAKGAKAAADLGKWGSTKLLSSLGGVKPEVINEYAQFSKRINAAPSVDALKDVSDNFVGKLASDVDAKKVSLDQAQEAYKGFSSELKDAYKTAGYDARDAVTSAQQTLKDAHNARLQQLSGDIYDTIGKLKTDVQGQSGQALETLNKSNAKVDLAPVYSSIDSTLEKLKGAGTDDASAVASKLQDYKARLMSKNWSNIGAPEAKKLIQGLDQITEYSPMAGSFDKAKNAAFKDVRSSLDQALKTSVPEYRKAMEPVAASADLLNRVSDFGDKQTAASLLSRLESPNQFERKAALDELGKRYGADYVSAAKPENLPQQDILNKAMAKQDALRPDRVAEKVDQTLMGSRQKSALDSAQSGLEQSQKTLAPFKPLAPNGAGQTLAQQKLTQLGQGKNIELTDMFQKLGKLTDTDFVQAMKDNNIKAAFQKGATNGSRNTLMGGLAGFAFGGVGGAAIGGSAGRVVDQWGPAITKKVLDGVIKVSERPTVATIASLELPESIKKNMIIGLENYLSKEGNPAQLQSVASDQPKGGEDRWASRGVSNLGIQDHDLAASLMQSKEGKRLLIEASDLSPGSPALKRIQTQIEAIRRNPAQK